MYILIKEPNKFVCQQGISMCVQIKEEKAELKQTRTYQLHSLSDQLQAHSEAAHRSKLQPVQDLRQC